MLLVCAVGGGDKEDEVGGAVLGAEVHGLGEAGHGERGNGHCGRAAVRDGDAAGDAGGGLLLAGEGVSEEAFNFGGAAGGSNPASQVADHVLGELPRFWSSSTSSVVMS